MFSPRSRATLALALCLTAAACGDDGTGPDSDDPLAQFIGTWDGVSMAFSNPANGLQVDPILAGGTLVITIGGDGRFSMTLQVPVLGLTQNDNGQFSVSGNQMTLATDGDPTPIVGTYTVEQNGTRVVLNATQGVEFDFDQNGSDEAATLRLTLQKR